MCYCLLGHMPYSYCSCSGFAEPQGRSHQMSAEWLPLIGIVILWLYVGISDWKKSDRR